MNNRFLRIISLIGVFFLSIVFIVEYYNGVVFNNEYTVLQDTILSNKINYLLRTTLWKFHLASGILLSLIFVVVWRFNKDTWLNKLFIKTITILVISGISNYSFENKYLHIAHIVVSIASIIIFIIALAENLTLGRRYA